MNSYIAKLIFNISIENKKEAAQFDEQIRIVQAKSHEHAFFKAKLIGQQEENSFKNQNNESVHWKFIDIVGLYPLNELKDGEQLYALTHEADDANSFIQFIREKSMAIQTNFLTFV
jgi:hypothetical protein